MEEIKYDEKNLEEVLKIIEDLKINGSARFDALHERLNLCEKNGHPNSTVQAYIGHSNSAYALMACNDCGQFYNRSLSSEERNSFQKKLSRSYDV